MFLMVLGWVPQVGIDSALTRTSLRAFKQLVDLPKGFFRIFHGSLGDFCSLFGPGYGLW